MVADLLDHDRAKFRDHLFSVGRRDGVLVFAPLDAGNRRLDVQPGALAADANAHGTGPASGLRRRQVPLHEPLRALRLRPPIVAGHEELAFDFHGHESGKL
jgi:hypothetical protein